MSERPCIEVEIRPWLSFILPKGITDRELEDDTGFGPVNAAGRTSMLASKHAFDVDSFREALGREIGMLAGWFDEKGYDVKFLGG